MALARQTARLCFRRVKKPVTLGLFLARTYLAQPSGV